MKKHLLRAALVASTAAALLLPTTAADAATLRSVDAKNDVWTLDPATGGFGKADSTPGNADVTRTVFKHTARKLVVTTTYTDLKKSGNRFAVDVEVRTNTGLHREAVVETFTKKGWTGTRHLLKGDKELSCRGFTHAIDYTANTVSITVPTGCLKKPRWVKVSVLGLATPDPNLAEAPIHADSGLSKKGVLGPVWSGRIRRG